MIKSIPTYPLRTLSDKESVEKKGLLLLDHQTTVTPEKALDIPHRTGWYGIGVCISGEAHLAANLEKYHIFPGCLIAMSPHIVKQWLSKSPDFETVAVLFAENLYTPSGDRSKSEFEFFERIAKNIFPLSKAQAEEVLLSIRFIHGKYPLGYRHGDQLLRTLIQALLLEVASLYEQFDLSVSALQTRAHSLAADFKRLLKLHFLEDRSVSFYAQKLFITSRHLTETVREVTGRTPGEWITEAVILEAKVLLLDHDLTIAQVADHLAFLDASTFGRYFKKNTGTSPAQYRGNY